MSAAAGGGQEAHPPPIVVLRGQLVVGHDDGGERDGDRPQHKDDREEAEDVVHDALPHGSEDEAKLEEEGGEGEGAGDEEEDVRLEVVGLEGGVDGAGDRADLLRVRAGEDAEAIGRADEGKGDRHEQPQREEREEGNDGDGAGGLVRAEDRIDEHKSGEDGRGDERARLEDEGP